MLPTLALLAAACATPDTGTPDSEDTAPEDTAPPPVWTATTHYEGTAGGQPCSVDIVEEGGFTTYTFEDPFGDTGLHLDAIYDLTSPTDWPCDYVYPLLGAHGVILGPSPATVVIGSAYDGEFVEVARDEAATYAGGVLRFHVQFAPHAGETMDVTSTATLSAAP